MKEPKIEIVPLMDAVIPDESNVNRHTQRGATLVNNSIRKRGLFRGIAAAGKGTDKPTVYAGNLTLEQAIDAGITEAVIVHTTGNQMVITVRDDVAPGSPEAVALGLEDNESGKQSYNPDLDLLATLVAGDGALLAPLREQDFTFDQMLEGMLIDNNYSHKVESPIYKPSGEKPAIRELFSDTKTKALIKDIQASSLLDEEKEFLIIAAQRHTVLHFNKIADYYASSEPEAQKLFEDSALIIIDFNKAIELGYVKLTRNIAEMVKEEYGED